MSECEHCKLIEDKNRVIFEDNEVVAVLSDKPSGLGHVLVMPRQHFTIMEQVPDSIIEKIAIISNKISTSMFELLRLNGTNILIENGTAAGQSNPHFSVNVIPRTENDGLKLSWEPKKFTEEQLALAESQIARELKEPEEKTEAPKKEAKILDDKDNYMIKQLKRLP
jgi:histidine triad (HIT) family protein